MRARRLVITVKHLPYTRILICLNLLTIKYRLIPEDMIEVYKILTNRYDVDVNLYLQQLQSNVTKGHTLKLY